MNSLNKIAVNNYLGAGNMYYYQSMEENSRATGELLTTRNIP